MTATNKNIRVWYLSGGMTKFGKEAFEESNKWRESIKDAIYDMSDHKIMCFNPNDHFNFEDDPDSFTDREAMELDIIKLRNSELVIYNNNDPFSRGSMIELGIAWERRIPIIVINENNNELHPWVESMAIKVLNSTSDFLKYVLFHYIELD